MPPQLIANRYRARHSGAGGGMGDIIQCTDTHLDRPVVIKTLRAGVESRRLLDEQKALSKLRSKHVVQLFDIVEMDTPGGTLPGLVLEHISGTDLAVGGFQQDQAYIRVLWQIACGLSNVHDAGIIHRDIKPTNIRMDDEGVVKILDFGLSRSAGEDDKTRSVIGTPVFMAPELWGQDTISFSSAVDVYAFGVTALALLHQQAPKELRQRPPEAVPMHVIQAATSNLPVDIVEILSACMSTRPATRPAMNAVVAILSKHLLRDRHRALVVMNAKPNHLDARHRNIDMSATGLGALSISYDGDGFLVNEASGNVYLNNVPATKASPVPDCCVITFGARGGTRQFVTFDVSNPEVMA